MKFNFKRSIVKSVFHNPRDNFEITQFHSEIRYDPPASCHGFFIPRRLSWTGMTGDPLWPDTTAAFVPFARKI